MEPRVQALVNKALLSIPEDHTPEAWVELAKTLAVELKAITEMPLDVVLDHIRKRLEEDELKNSTEQQLSLREVSTVIDRRVLLNGLFSFKVQLMVQEELANNGGTLPATLSNEEAGLELGDGSLPSVPFKAMRINHSSRPHL